MFCYLMGDPKSLFGRVATRVNPIEVEDCISASLEMQSGALASFTASLGSADEITRIRLAFDNVTIESDHAAYNPGGAVWKMLPRNDETRRRIEARLAGWTPVPSRFQTQMAWFHEALESGGPLPVTTADSRRALEIVTAFYYSSRTHREVEFPIGADHPLYRSWLPEEVA
jgi:predicted dehydrogenase